MDEAAPVAQPPRCPLHTDAEARWLCAACQRPLCSACYELCIDDQPGCRRCGYAAATRRQRGLSIAVSLLGLAAALALWLARNASIRERYGLWIALGAVLAVVAAPIAALLMRGEHSVERRDRGAEPGERIAHPPRAARGPYRRGPGWLGVRFAPRVSGGATAGAVGASLVLAAVLLPYAFDLPRWIEAEVVLVAWWFVFASTLALLLHRGYRLRDDFLFVPVWDPTRRKRGGRAGWSIDFAGGCSTFDVEGCATAIAVLVGIILVAGAAWLVVELALPIVLFLSYSLILRALNRVAHDRHGCQRKLGRSLGWGALWATLYLAPLALVTFLLQLAVS